MNPMQQRALALLRDLGGSAKTMHLVLGHGIYRATLQALERRGLTRTEWDGEEHRTVLVEQEVAEL